jgi:DNA-binding response OmpR family regulator
LVKPFSFEELLARIKALLRRPVTSLPIELQVGDIRMDTKTRRVFLRDKPVRLTAKEYALLEYLMRHPDEVIDRERIIDHLWGFEFESFSNVVDVHMKNLRKKIEGRRGRKMLETVRGMGYRLNTA